MPTIYLHHYPESLFSEKIRALLGYLDLPWRSVVIPNVMPRPLLMPLSGGYRRTPCLQIDANVYCDTAVIAQGLVRLAGDASIYAPGFTAQRVAEWADTQLFRVTVALNFAPEAIGAMMSGMSADDVAAFARDRAALSEGGSLQTLTPVAARACLDQYLAELEASLEAPFLFGERPSIADFSVYHCLWFLRQSAHNAPLLDPFPAIGRWLGRIAAFGHGERREATGEEALAQAKQAEPVLPPLSQQLPPGVELGAAVRVTPVDYGLIPVEGRLVAAGPAEVVLERETPETGRVFTHFPTSGFEVARA